MIGPHRGAAACILLLWKLSAPRFVGSPALKILHPLIELSAECCFFPTKVMMTIPLHLHEGQSKSVT